MDFTIRAAKPAEFGHIGELTVDAYVRDGLPPDSPYTQQLRTAALRAAQAQLLAAVDADGTLLGSVTYADGDSPWAEVTHDDEAEFRMLVVGVAARGRGIGEALVRACITRAREAGHRALVLSTEPRMTTAHRLYDRLGFLRDASRDWSPRPDVDLLFYERPLR